MESATLFMCMWVVKQDLIDQVNFFHISTFIYLNQKRDKSTKLKYKNKGLKF